MLDDKAEAQIMADLLAINRRTEQYYKEESALHDDIEKVKDTDAVEYTLYQKLKKELEDNVAFVKNIMNSAEIQSIAENVQKAVESSKDNADVKEIDNALYIEGIIKVTEALAVTKFDKTAYETGSLKNPFRLKANLRINAEKQVESLQSLLINSIPLDKETIKKLDPRQAAEAFKGVVLNSFDELQRTHELHPHIESIKKHLLLKECLIKFVAYPLEMANVYCGTLDLNIPIDRGLVEWQDKQLATIKENQKVIDGQADKVVLLNRQNGANEDTIKVQQQQISTNQARIELQKDEVNAIRLQIEKLNKDKDDAETEEEGGEE